MADIGLVLRKQQSKLGEALSKKTHFTIAEIENLLTLYRLFFVRNTASINPKCDYRLFSELQVQYKKTTSSANVIDVTLVLTRLPRITIKAEV